MASQLPMRPPQLNNTSPTNAGGTPLLSGQPPRPPGLFKPPPGARSHPANTPVSGDGQRRTPEPIIGRWRLLSIATALLVLILLFIYDPLAGIIDVESAKQRASVENATLVFEKQKTERKREVMARERKLWEEAREARVPRSAFWDVVWPAWDCLAYGKREYWGILRNIPKGWNAVDACMNTPVEIKGVKIRRPDRCSRVFVLPDPEFQVRGYWVVDWDQPDCKPWYRDFEDKECTGYNSGKRQIEAQIVGINDKGGQDWRLLCNSTPLVWYVVTYASPARCEERLWGKKIATWDVPDENCLS